MFWRPLLLILAGCMSFSAIDSDKRTKSDFLLDYLSIRYPDHQFESFLYVEVKQQQIHLVENGQFTHSYPISTGLNGLGTENGSNCTPPGLHKISSILGKDAPVGGVIKGHRFTGIIGPIHKDGTCADDDYVLTRAMRLQGMEPGKNQGGNVDTHKRHIYIHGTAEEGRIGTPVSHGCIRMLNEDIVELESLISRGILVVILNI